ncbi:threonine-phosphate decarboxylase CobD [Paenibacillus sp. SI8]|uniref:threonine-phosphate decarboxylase CobD n=1 Tax=unclassified Paenibacillus TaxID=185978 RepID=UPI0034654F8A
MLERYGHGGDLRTAEEAFGRSQDQFLDFSSNMNPLGPPSVVEHIVTTEWRDMVQYPDPAVRELRRKLAHKYDIPMESIAVGNGAAELIDLIARVLQSPVTGLARPSFSEYEEAIHKAGGDIHSIPLHAHYHFDLQEDDVKKALLSSDVLFLGHPNNPTGRLIPPAILKQITESGRKLIVDEAFMDFVPDERKHSMLKFASTSSNVFVIRSMTKFFSIPGIRLGFMVAHPDWIQRIQELQVQWSVNYLAQRIGAAVLDDVEFEQASRQWLQAEQIWLMGQLQQLGLEVTPSAVNFLLFSFPQELGFDVKQAQRHMGKQGILIRDASLFEGLDQRFCRVAIKLREDNERLVQGLRAMMQELAGDRSRGNDHG